MGDNIKKKPSCNECNKLFTNRSCLVRHLRQVHMLDPPIGIRKKKYKCPLCGVINSNFELYKDHVALSHEIILKMHFFEFKQQSHFLVWKRKVEQQTKSRYVKETGTKVLMKNNRPIPISEETKPCITKKIGLIQYRCHRSGFCSLKDETERKRRFKAQGTAKINAYCPADITARFKSNGSVRVVYCSTHIGHEFEVSHLRLTDAEKRDIAAKIAAKIPDDVILDEIRNNSESAVSRKHILCKQDLRKIASSSFFKEYSQSLKSTPILHNGESNIKELPASDKLLDNFNECLHPAEILEDTEVESLGPNDAESDSDSSSDNGKFVWFESDNSKKISNVEDYNSPIQYNTNFLLGHDKNIDSQNLCSNKYMAPLDKTDELSFSKRQNELIEKISAHVNSFKSLNEINWFESNIDQLIAIFSKVRNENTQIWPVGRNCQTLFSKENPMKAINTVPSAPQRVRYELFPQMSSPQILKPPTKAENHLSKTLRPQLALGLKNSHHNCTCHSINQITGSRKLRRLKPILPKPNINLKAQINLKPNGENLNIKQVSNMKTHVEPGGSNKKVTLKQCIDTVKMPIHQCVANSKVETVTRARTIEESHQASIKIKKYLIPIKGKPGNFLVVQTKPNEPPPLVPLTPVTPNQKPSSGGVTPVTPFPSDKKPSDIRNAVTTDHTYSSP